MARGRKRKPTPVLERGGTFRKNPQRRRTREPVTVAGAPTKPGYIKSDDVASDEWDALCRILDSMDILSTADRSVMAIYCETYSQWVRVLKHIRQHGMATVSCRGTETTSSEARAYHKLGDRLLKLLTEMGLTPASRSRVETNKPEVEPSPMAALMERMRNG